MKDIESLLGRYRGSEKHLYERICENTELSRSLWRWARLFLLRCSLLHLGRHISKVKARARRLPLQRSLPLQPWSIRCRSRKRRAILLSGVGDAEELEALPLEERDVEPLFGASQRQGQLPRAG